LLRDWNDGASRASGAAEYQLAREASQAGDRVASLQHLEQAILLHPMHAEAARQDGDFDSIRGPVLDLVGRVSILARIRAESSIADALSAIDSVRAPHATELLAQARTYSDLAQAQFQQGSYAAYVEAAQAAIRAQQIAAGIKMEPDAKLAAARAAGVVDRPRVTRLLWRTTRRLWQRLPLLAILLGWLFAGIIAGVAALPFREGGVVEMRRILFPIWAMGLLGMVLIGFVRSILRLRGRRLK
jgi:tetratricopeptide (TPR) repeat protein